MTQAQPPAGWYPDPQDATQQRYWDGTAWTGHTAAAGAASSAPVGDAAAGAAIPSSAAPAWSMPADAGMADPSGSGKKAWYKRKAFLIPVAIVVVLFVAGIIVALVQGTDHSKDLENAIKDDGQAQLQKSVDENVPGAKVSITDVSCVETGSSQNYTCQIHMTLTSPDGSETVKLLQQATGSCDTKVNAHCLWHTQGDPTKDNS